MTSAYGGSPGTGTLGISALAYLPLVTVLSSRRVAVGAIRKEEWEPCRVMMNVIIDEGLSWPFLQEYDTMDAFCGYFLSHAAFVVRAEEAGVDSDGNPSQKGDLLGMFYVKPNFPGRCASATPTPTPCSSTLTKNVERYVSAPETVKRWQKNRRACSGRAFASLRRQMLSSTVISCG